MGTGNNMLPRVRWQLGGGWTLESSAHMGTSLDGNALLIGARILVAPNRKLRWLPPLLACPRDTAFVEGVN
jgi:hypothetical protein